MHKSLEEYLDRAEQALIRAENSRTHQYSGVPTGELDTQIAGGWIELADVHIAVEMLEIQRQWAEDSN